MVVSNVDTSGGASGASLRRTLFPKSPWIILEDLARGLQLEVNYKFLEPVEEEGMKLFPCEVSVNGEPYQGAAPEKEVAKNIASEMAIQSYVAHAVSAASNNPEVKDPLDNAPWAELASLGLFKLFNDWMCHGFQVPLLNHPVDQQQSQLLGTVGGEQPDFVHKPCKKLPDDPTSRHPVQLINEVFPGSEFTCLQVSHLHI